MVFQTQGPHKATVKLSTRPLTVSGVTMAEIHFYNLTGKGLLWSLLCGSLLGSSQFVAPRMGTGCLWYLVLGVILQLLVTEISSG